MLVLSRKTDERIVIGDNITVTLLAVRGNTVRLGIDAPREIRVVRGEIVSREPEPGHEADPERQSREAHEQVFAHAEPSRGRRAARIATRMRAAGTNRISATHRRGAGTAAGPEAPRARPRAEAASEPPQLFAGAVDRSGRTDGLHRIELVETSADG